VFAALLMSNVEAPLRVKVRLALSEVLLVAGDLKRASVDGQATR